MNNGTILILTFIITGGIAIIIRYQFYLRKKRHAETIISDWNKFEKAISNRHIKGVNKFGTELIWNEHLTMNKLNQISDSINNLGEDYSELEDLKMLIYNKRLDWNKEYPSM